MNNIAELHRSSAHSLSSDQKEYQLSSAETDRVGAGALTHNFSPNVCRHRQGQESKLDWQSPTPSYNSSTMLLAEDALNRILQTFGGNVSVKPVTLAEFERTPMEAMALASALLGVKALGDNANLKSLALEIRTQGVENLRLRQNETLRQQIDKAIHSQDKANKINIFSNVIDWVISVVEVLSGVAKVVVGDVAGGSMDCAAGCAGLVKAFSGLMALINDEETAKKWKDIADVAGKTQLAFEISGMMVDLVSVGRGMMATKSIGKSTKEVMEMGLDESLLSAIRKRNPVDIDDASRLISQSVASSTLDNVLHNAPTTLRNRWISRKGVEDALKVIVMNGIKRAVSRQPNQIDMLVKMVQKEVQKELFHEILRASVKSTPNIVKIVSRGVLSGSNSIAKGVINGERANIQNEIQHLMSENDFIQFLLDDFEKVKKRTNSDMRNIMDGAGKSISSASEMQNSTNAVLSSIATHIV